jgi:hypothetical protein
MNLASLRRRVKALEAARNPPCFGPPLAIVEFGEPFPEFWPCPHCGKGPEAHPEDRLYFIEIVEAPPRDDGHEGGDPAGDGLAAPG